MATVHDVASYVLRKQGPMTSWKLQKLVYYSQAWSLVWDDKPLFRAKIEAWANGPVVRALYEVHRGKFKVRPPWPLGNWKTLSKDERETVNAILKHYGPKSSHWLSQLTHQENPWRDARRGIPPGTPSNAEITHESMAAYYSSLV